MTCGGGGRSDALYYRNHTGAPGVGSTSQYFMKKKKKNYQKRLDKLNLTNSKGTKPRRLFVNGKSDWGHWRRPSLVGKKVSFISRGLPCARPSELGSFFFFFVTHTHTP